MQAREKNMACPSARPKAVLVPEHKKEATTIGVTLTRTEPGRLSMRAGHVDFRAVPVRRSEDFDCSPSDVISFESAVQVANELSKGKRRGTAGRYEWRMDLPGE